MVQDSTTSSRIRQQPQRSISRRLLQQGRCPYNVGKECAIATACTSKRLLGNVSHIGRLSVFMPRIWSRRMSPANEELLRCPNVVETRVHAQRKTCHNRYYKHQSCNCYYCYYCYLPLSLSLLQPLPLPITTPTTATTTARHLHVL